MCSRLWLVVLTAIAFTVGLTGSSRPVRAQTAVKTGLRLTGSPNDAEISIDGDLVGTTPAKEPISLPAGEHTIRVSRPGFTPFIDVFRVKEGRLTSLEFELVPISGVLRLSTPADKAKGRVYVDDRYIGETPTDEEIPTGNHNIRVERPGYYSQTFPVTAVAGKLIEKELTLVELPPDQNPLLRKPQAKWYQKGWVWAVGAVGVAAIATAIIVPVVLSRRSVCDGLDVCIENVGANTPALTVGVSF